MRQPHDFNPCGPSPNKTNHWHPCQINKKKRSAHPRVNIILNPTWLNLFFWLISDEEGDEDAERFFLDQESFTKATIVFDRKGPHHQDDEHFGNVTRTHHYPLSLNLSFTTMHTLVGVRLYT
mmetsp:Transcript_35145/g.73199  ORF Transcript_35145/g.73199 Transcript_35145/m.73199 type:complete len:122 (-) Transcript_35145:1073-1438(-)